MKTDIFKKAPFWIILVATLAALVLVWQLNTNTGEEASVGNDIEVTEESSSYEGLSEEDAAQAAEARGLAHRVVHRDGENLAITMDYNPERLNFWVEDGVVFAALTDEEMTSPAIEDDTEEDADSPTE